MHHKNVHSVLMTIFRCITVKAGSSQSFAVKMYRNVNIRLQVTVCVHDFNYTGIKRQEINKLRHLLVHYVKKGTNCGSMDRQVFFVVVANTRSHDLIHLRSET